MLKIAIICASDLPIPAVLGGATETMITNILAENSSNPLFKADVFSYYNEKAEKESFELPETHFFWYKESRLYQRIKPMFWFISRLLLHLSRGIIPLQTSFIKFCASIINKNHYDCVLLEGGTMQIRQLRSLLNPEIKIILHIHTDVLNDSTPVDAHRVAASADGIIAVSNYEKSRLATLGYGILQKTVVVKNAIDLERFIYCGDTRRMELRKSLGISKEDKVIIFCGRLSVDKGIMDLLDAMDLLDPEYKLLVVGSVWFNVARKDEFFARLLKKVEGNERVILTGYIPQNLLADYYSISDIAVFPSKIGETAGLVCIEALACGLPVLVPILGGMKEYASANVSVQIDTLNNCQKQIADAIINIFSDHESYASMRQHARENVMQFSVENQHKQLSDSIHMFLGDKA